MDYPIMEPPFIVVPYEQMNKKQVEQYFHWYMEIKEERIAQLENFIKEEVPTLVLDKTPESLIPLWEWYEKKLNG